jgi:phosphopantetheinyl transferase (holo-ACP synthase)
VANDCRGIAVHAVHFFHGRGPVFYASMPCEDQDRKGYGTNGTADKHLLASILLDHHMARGRPFRKCSPSGSRTDFPIQVVSGPLGRPYLQVGENRGPAISFSTGGGKLWAALSGEEPDIGIDIAAADEFQGGFPFHRVFQPDELHHAVKLAGGDPAEASALLWSIKEAVVKALGCAFHLMDPQHITVFPSAGGDIGYTFPVGLSGKALARFPRAAGSAFRVRSLPQGTMWLSIALWNRRPAGHE